MLKLLRTATILAGLGVLAASAQASADGTPPVGFDGSCTLAGTAQFLPPGGLLPAVSEDQYQFLSDSTSTCTGRIFYGDMAVSDARVWPVSVIATDHGHLSCGSSILLGGVAQIAFRTSSGQQAYYTADDTSVPLILYLGIDTISVGNEVVVHISGGADSSYPYGTNATGLAQFGVDQQAAQGCIDGTIAQLRFTANVSTGPSVPNSQDKATTILLSR